MTNRYKCDVKFYRYDFIHIDTPANLAGNDLKAFLENEVQELEFKHEIDHDVFAVEICDMKFVKTQEKSDDQTKTS